METTKSIERKQKIVKKATERFIECVKRFKPSMWKQEVAKTARILDELHIWNTSVDNAVQRALGCDLEGIRKELKNAQEVYDIMRESLDFSVREGKISESDSADFLDDLTCRKELALSTIKEILKEKCGYHEIPQIE